MSFFSSKAQRKRNSNPMTTAPDSRTASICDALALREGGELISIVGGGGKSALLFALGGALPGRTILTTTTRIFAAQTARAAETFRFGTAECEAALRTDRRGLLVIGAVEGDKAKGVAREAPGEMLAVPGVDFVIVEADGSRMLPAKAPASHEPVIPDETTLVVAVAGIDALEGPISKTCHRPEQVAGLLGVSEAHTLDPQDLASLLCHEDGGLKNLPRGARAALFINKIESPDQWQAGRELARSAQSHSRVDRIVLGAIEPGGAEATRGPRPADLEFEIFLGRAAEGTKRERG